MSEENNALYPTEEECMKESRSTTGSKYDHSGNIWIWSEALAREFHRLMKNRDTLIEALKQFRSVSKALLLEDFGIKELKDGLTIERIVADFPWILAADISGATLGVDIDNMLIWYSGIWHSGTWKNGRFLKGTWEGGIWIRGVFENGTWEDGVWMFGLFLYGTWKNGTWKDGDWNNGDWISGQWLSRAPHPNDKKIDDSFF